MMSNFHKTTSERWQRTPSTEKSSPFSLKGGRTKYKRQKNETEEFGMETHPKEGVVKEEKFPNNREPSHRWICGEFRNLRGQHNWEKKKKKKRIPQNMRLTTTASREVAWTLASTTSEQGLDREEWTV